VDIKISWEKFSLPIQLFLINLPDETAALESEEKIIVWQMHENTEIVTSSRLVLAKGKRIKMGSFQSNQTLPINETVNFQTKWWLVVTNKKLCIKKASKDDWRGEFSEAQLV